MTRPFAAFVAMLAAAAIAPVGPAQSSFVNFESPHINPLDITPDGSKLLAVNTADNRLEIYTLTPTGPVHSGSVPVGLDPVSVRARTSTEAWVVNHISDSVSVVDLAAMNVKATIATGDEPCDVVFAGSPQRAFVSVSQLNQVRVYNPLNLAQAPTIITIQGEDPRAMATDGTSVYAAIFESGNRTTILSQTAVSNAATNPYPGDPNPPPNSGTAFSPPIGGGLPTPPPVSLIVKRDAGANIWRDDNPTGANVWPVPWNVHDNDVAVINAGTLGVTYVKSLMNLNMNVSVRPISGQVTVIGTDATNQVRFEPNVRGRFIRVVGATFNAGGGGTPSITDLNPHLTYATFSIPPALRAESIGDPRGIAWRGDGQRAFITGMGSNNVIVADAALARLGRVDVGQGPTGVKVDDARGLAYVLNRFEASLSVIDIDALSELERLPMHDATPAIVNLGRTHLYDTHATSGLGHLACASCHVDGRMDQLSWDLGDPSGAVKIFNQTCQVLLPGACENWHPMKGPMATQTLTGIINTEPFHWRGDRENLAAFNGAFVNLLGADAPLTAQQMDDFTAMVASLKFPPNPNRNLNNSLPTSFPNGGNPATGENRFLTQPIDGGFITCVTCHALPAGTSGQITPAMALQESQSMKIPQLRNLYEKTGFSATSQTNNRGFGFVHDGSFDNLITFLQAPVFIFNPNFGSATQQRRDIEAFLHCFPSGTHAAVGAQATAAAPADQQALISQFIALANSNAVGLVVKGRQNGVQRGWAYVGGGTFQSDRAGETISTAALQALAAPGSELTYTVVPLGSQTRIGIDRDEDGALDMDEIEACSDPADAKSLPGTLCRADIAPAETGGDGQVNFDDVLLILQLWGSPGGPADIAPGPPACGDGSVNFDDILFALQHWGPCR